METNNFWRLEYNQTTGDFHFEDTRKDNKETAGYLTICDSISEIQCVEFCQLVNHMVEEPFPTIEILRDEFVAFLESTPILTPHEI
jgi:hypothetical protein